MLFLIAINLLGGISNLSCHISLGDILFGGSLSYIGAIGSVFRLGFFNSWISCCSSIANKLLDDIDCTSGRTWLGSQDLSGLINNEDPTGGAVGLLLQADRRDEGQTGIAKKRIGELLLLLESSVALWRVLGETIDGKAGGGEIGVGVAEITYLSGT